MDHAQARKRAVVTGGNRGIGFEVCRQLAQQGFEVVLAARTLQQATEAAAKLQQEGLQVSPFQLEVTSREDRENLRDHLKQQGGLDVLVNNAGIYPDEGQSILHVPLEQFEQAMQVNAFAPLDLTRLLLPLLEPRRGCVVNVSSEMGAWEDLHPSTSAYRLSKLALNGITVMLARAARGKVRINAACPGWVKTDMGGPDAPGTVQEGAASIVWVVNNVHGTAGFYQNGKVLDW